MTVITFTNSLGGTFADNTTIAQTIEVFGTVGTIEDVSVSFTNLTHTWSADLDFLLVAPDNTNNLMFLSDAGGSSGPSGNYTFSDDAPSAYPNPALPGAYRATTLGDNETVSQFTGATVPSLNFAGEGIDAFANAFGGLSANGTWQGYFHDDAGGDQGSYDSWSISFRTTSGDVQVVGSSGADTLRASWTAADAGSFQLNGASGLFSELSGSVILDGQGGDDTLISGSGSEILIGGAGVDTATYGAATAGVNVSLAIIGAQDTGGGGIDVLTGIENLIGSSSNDTLAGNSAANTLDGSSGSDTASYAAASSGVQVSLAIAGAQDTIGDGIDTLFSIENLIGSDFSDALTGNTDNNTLEGGLGNDVLDGGDGFDIASYARASGGVSVSLNSDSSSGAAGMDVLIGIEGIVGSNFDDTLTGDAAANSIDGLGGNDMIDAGDGDDTVRITSSQFSGTIEGGAGNDLIVLNFLDATSGVNIMFDGDLSNSAFLTLNGNAIAQTGFESVSVTSFATNFDDVIDDTAGTFADGANTTFYTRDGDDTIIFGLYLDIVDAGNGDDLIVASSTGYGYLGNAGSDTVDYSRSADGVSVNLQFQGGYQAISDDQGSDFLSGIENLIGSDFNDVLAGDANDNTFEGGIGDDILVGGDGTDTASYASASSGVTVSLAASGPQDTGGAGTDSLSEFENLTGSAFADTLTGNSGDNILIGDGGNDTLDGGLGDDIIDGGAGLDIVDLSAAGAPLNIALSTTNVQVVTSLGSDTLISIEGIIGTNLADVVVGTEGANEIYGRGGADIISGGGGNDILDGGEGSNIIRGGSGSDRITTGSGSDIIDAGSGSDTIRAGGGDDLIRGWSGDDTISGGAGNDFIDGGVGFDIADYNDASGAVYVNLSLQGMEQDTLAGGMDTLLRVEGIIGSEFGDVLFGDANANYIDGARGADRIGAGAGNDTVYGGFSVDTIYGEDGNDTIYGGSNNDFIGGNAGDDVLYGDFGADNVRGGSGNDRLIGDDGDDRLYGDGGADTILGGSGIDYILGGTGSDNVNGGFGNDFIRGQDGNDTLAGALGNDDIGGGDGDDRIRGGLGNDTLAGNGGSDTFVLDEALGANNVDTILDMIVGEDTIELDLDIFTAITGGGTLSADQFRAGTSATTADHRIIFTRSTGELFYDADGSGSGAQVKIAQLDIGNALTASAFTLAGAQEPIAVGEKLPEMLMVDLMML